MKRTVIRLTSFIVLLIGVSLHSAGQDLPNTNFSMANVGSGWSEPVGVTFSKTGSKSFVWEKGGKVYVLNRVGTTSGYTKQTTPVLDISPEVGNWRDHGLLGFALDPNFDTNGFIYLLYVVDRHYLIYFGTGTYNAATNDYYKATIGRITRYKTKTSGSNLVADLTTRTILLGETKSTGIPILHESHGVGSLAFAADGTLLASAGDAASYNTVDVGSLSETYYSQAITDGIIRSNENVGAMRSQMINSHCGKILRLDPTNGNGVSSNPFYQSGSPRSAQSRVWAMGFRNPFRFSVKPNTGSTNPATGDLGELYVGDVGWDKYEELNVIKAKATNCGWPIFEGITAQSGYSASTTLNRDESNPLYGGGCSQQYFQFKQLIRQANLNNSTAVYNPCNSSTLISSPAPNRFLHRIPVLDWKHGEDSARVAYYNSSTLRVAQIGSASSNVTGSPFQGSSVVGGCWYTGSLFPSMYKNSYFMADYGGSWIKNVVMLSVDKVDEVRNFSNSGFGAVVCIAENPADGSLFCADIGTGNIVRIGYGGNQPPVVKMASDKTYGTAPLTVSFNSTGTYDPEGGALTYSWNFGDGTSVSTAANPGNHVFTTSNGQPKKFTVILTVKDNQNQTSVDSIIISANNTPPVVTITSPAKNSFYQLGADTAYKLQATVTDAQHSSGQLKYEWQVALRHNSHQHVEPIDTNKLSSAMISRIGCNGDTYYWFVKLTVTDAAGLSTVDSSRMYPQCGGPLPVVLTSFDAITRNNVNILNWTTSSEINLRMFEIERSYDGIHFETIGGVNANRLAGPGNYEWKDENHNSGYNYYRLRMVDFSGYYKYSAIVKVFCGIITGNELVVSPNPANDYLVWGTQLQQGGVASVRLISSNGAVVKKMTEKTVTGFNSFRIDGLQKLPAGLYILEISTNGVTRKSKVLLTRAL
jgi:glucose/arabinose dehydrogenase